MPRESQLPADAEVHEAQGGRAEAGGELRTARVRLVGDLDDGAADRQAGPGREVLFAEVEIDVELVAGEGAVVLGAAGDQSREPGVDDVQLHVRVRRAVAGPPAPAPNPGVADNAFGQRQLRDLEDLALVDRRAADDEVELAVVLRGVLDVCEPRLERLEIEMDGGDPVELHVGHGAHPASRS